MAILTSGYGTGLTKKQKEALAFRLNPGVSDSQDGSGSLGDDMELVSGGSSVGVHTPLSLKTTTSFVVTDTAKTHVSLANGILGQVKRIVHSTRLNNTDLVITPANFAGLKKNGAAGTKITSNLPNRSVTLMYDGDNWQVIAGEIAGTAEFVIA